MDEFIFEVIINSQSLSFTTNFRLEWSPLSCRSAGRFVERVIASMNLISRFAQRWKVSE